MEDPKFGETNLSERLLGDEESPSPNNNNEVDEIIVDPIQAGHTLRGEAQTAQYRDTPFALAFLGHLVVVLCLSFFVGLPAMFGSEEDRRNVQGYDFHIWGFYFLLVVVSTLSIGVASVSLDFMIHHGESMMQIALMASCVVLGADIVLLFMNGSPGLGFLGLFVLICTGLYAYSVQRRIPFAAANLRTALSAIQTNYGVCMVAYAVAVAANFFVVLWVLAFAGVAFKVGGHGFEEGQHGEFDFNLNPFLVTFMILSYYWTAQVLQVRTEGVWCFVLFQLYFDILTTPQNIIHVTVSGIIGTWWFAPQEAQSAFSPAIVDSFSRATTYSFGSICFGSLLVAIIQTMERIVHSMRHRRQNNILLCIMECLLHFLQRVGQYFNKWAFVYVGLYGYDYITAGRKALELFQSRGWSVIINDNLVYRMLMLVSIVVGAISGLVGMFLADLSGWADPLFGADFVHLPMFLICFGIGFSLASILMGVVISACDSVIVCFAEAPGEFETHHPALHRNMVNAWRQVYPEECGF